MRLTRDDGERLGAIATKLQARHSKDPRYRVEDDRDVRYLRDLSARALAQDALGDCDDLCACGHERFHHDDGREMGVLTNCKAHGCGCTKFEAVG
jgi:hypothetical protein